MVRLYMTFTYRKRRTFGAKCWKHKPEIMYVTLFVFCFFLSFSYFFAFTIDCCIYILWFSAYLFLCFQWSIFVGGAKGTRTTRSSPSQRYVQSLAAWTGRFDRGTQTSATCWALWDAYKQFPGWCQWCHSTMGEFATAARRSCQGSSADVC